MLWLGSFCIILVLFNLFSHYLSHSTWRYTLCHVVTLPQRVNNFIKIYELLTFCAKVTMYALRRLTWYQPRHYLKSVQVRLCSVFSIACNGSFRGMETLSTLSKLFCLPSERGLLFKERICSLREQILSLKSRPLFRRGLFCRLANRGHKSCIPCFIWLKIKQVYYVPLSKQLRPWSDYQSAQADVRCPQFSMLWFIHFWDFYWFYFMYI